MTQVLAILEDSLRALRSRSLFWISLGISVLAAVMLFGLLGFNEKGMTVLWFSIESDRFHAGSAEARDLVAWMFNNIYVRWWLSWAAIAVALISTASIVPDFLASGAIDLSLAKPISRVKLLGLRIVGAMLFVALQVAVGVSLVWLLMGARSGLWLPAVFLAIPLIVLQFFYLYAVSVLVAVHTRSTLASLLVTLVFWGSCAGVQFCSNQIDSQVAQADVLESAYQAMIDRVEHQAAEAERPLTFNEQSKIDSYRGQIRMMTSLRDWVKPWQPRAAAMELTVPKTGDIQKILANRTRAPVLNDFFMDSDILDKLTGVPDPDEQRALLTAGQAGQRAIRDVHATSSILSSLVVTLIVLAWAVVVFCRRDY